MRIFVVRILKIVYFCQVKISVLVNMSLQIVCFIKLSSNRNLSADIDQTLVAYQNKKVKNVQCWNNIVPYYWHDYIVFILYWHSLKAFSFTSIYLMYKLYNQKENTPDSFVIFSFSFSPVFPRHIAHSNTRPIYVAHTQWIYVKSRKN